MRFIESLAAVCLALLLTACGAPDSPSVGTATPAASVPTTSAPEAEPVALDIQLPEILPPSSFTPDSYWLAEPYGDGGAALMMLRQLPGGGAELTCRYSVFTTAYEGEPYSERSLTTGSFSSTVSQDGSFAIYEVMEAGLLIVLDSGKLEISYPDTETYKYLPRRFYAVTEDGARSAWRDMPYNSEARIPLPATASREALLATPGVEDIGEGSYKLGGMSFSYTDNYRLESVSVTEPGTGFSVRGIDVGSGLDDICGNFGFSPSSPTDRKTFYGSDGFMSSRAQIWPDDSGRSCVYLLDNGRSHVFIYLDDAGVVEEIAYWRFL